MKIAISKKMFIMLEIILVFALVVSVTLWNPVIRFYEFNANQEYDNWSSSEYDSWDCSDTAPEIEKYFETEFGLDTLFVYGVKFAKNGTITSAHIWNKVNILGVWYDFESSCLKFQNVDYEINWVQNGFYIDGVHYDKSQPYEDWDKYF